MRNPSPRYTRRTAQRGIALVIVLALLVLILGLVITFLTRSRVERTASAGYAAAAGTRQLADLAVNLVQGQIRDATSQGSSVVWASQPGMIRTFGADGNLALAYKLYSASQLIARPPLNATDDYPANTWATDRATWTDLNSPVTSGSTSYYPIVDPGASGTVAGFSIVTPPTVGTTNLAPMPVRWLYVLQNGSLVAPSGAGDTATVASATAANPIVGRIAFWTDDETCKVNINTACGDEPSAPVGSFWDTPRVDTTNERLYFGDRMMVQNEFQRFPGHPATVYLSKIFPTLTRANLAAITPRVESGGTLGGTQVSTQPVILDKDRLYSTVDEVLLKPSRGMNAGLSSSQVEQAKFFLTTTSRAPEVNIFDKPRIAMWPIDGRGDAFLTPYDKLMKFCSTVNGQHYYFARSDSTSLTADASANLSLYNYLEYLTRQSIPGFSGNFSTKYSGGRREQILVEMLDYIRCTNLNDSLLAPANRYTADATGLGQVVPMTMAGKRGFGRFYTLSEAALVFSNEAENGQPLKTGTAAPVPSGTGEKVIQAGLALQPFCAAQGPFIIFMNSAFEVSGLDTLQVRNNAGVFVPLFDSGSKTSLISRVNAGSFLYDGRALGGNSDFRHLLFNNNNPFLGNRITVKGTNLEFSGGSITVKIYGSALVSPSKLVQTITFTFPPSTAPGFPMPVYNSALLPMVDRWTGSSNIGSTSAKNNATVAAYALVADVYDVVRSVRLLDGDPRQSALLADPSTRFGPHADYNSTTLVKAHGLVYGANIRVAGRTTAKLVGVSGSYNLNYAPTYPKGLASVTTGDFDNGMADNMDGAYINKPDEGATNYFAGGGTSPSPSSLFSPNRMIPSPGMFGSLPTGVAWQTLLFRPQAGHPNASTIAPDHLFMDLFWMPVVQPYAISESLSTAGKINLNERLMPFSYINRTTALAAAIQGEQYLAIPDTAVADYKPGGAQIVDLRHPVNADYLISQITTKLATDVFRSPSQICDLDLDSINWSANRLTGDNSRERPYANLYQKLTTKSNSFTVHYRVQALRKVQNSAPATWNEKSDKVVGEFRGSTVIERYIDPNDTTIPDYLSNPSATPTLGSFYKWRVLSARQFSP